MAIGGVVLQWAAKTAQSVRDVDKLTKSLDKQQKSASSLGNVLKGSLKAGVAGIGVAAVGAGFALVDMAKAAYDDQQAALKLDRALRRIPGVTKRAAAAAAGWVDQMELATGVADDDLRAALARLTPATKNLAQAQKLAALAADAATVSGKSYESVTVAMAKAAAGNTQSLKRMFPWLDAGSDKVLTLAEAMEQLEGKYGGAAAAAEKNDIFGRLAVVWGQLKEALGSAFLPILNEIADWFADTKNQTKMQEWIGKVQEWATTVGEDLLGKIKEFIDWLKSPEGKQAIDDFMGKLQGLLDVVNFLITALGKLKTLWDWYTNADGPSKWADDPRNFFSPDAGGMDYGYGNNNRGGMSPHRYTSTSKGGTVVNITNNYPKPERASDNTARSLRQSRYVMT